MNLARRYGIGFVDGLLLAFCLAALGLTVLYPSLRLIVSAATGWEASILSTSSGMAAVRNTVLISFASVATSGLLGTGLAFLLTRYSFPGGRILAGVAYLPFTLPPLVGVVSFYYLIGRDGLLPRFLEQIVGTSDSFLEGPAAILAVHTYSFYVFFYAMVSAALQNLDVSQLEAARTLGAGRWRVFRRVTFPMLKPALTGAALLTFMSSGASFSAPLIFGGDFPMLSVRVYEEQQQFHTQAALTLTVVLALVSLLGILLFRSRPQPSGTGTKGVRRPLRSSRSRLVAGLLAWAAILVLLAPHLAIFWLSFVNHREWHEELVPLSFTLENYRTIFTDPNALSPIVNSLWMSALAAVGALLVALPAAYLIGRRRGGARWVNLLVMLPWALPGTVVAMNLIAAFNEPWLPLYNTVWMLPLAYYVRSVPVLTRVVTSAVEPFDTSLIEAGRTLGGSRFFCLTRIALPLLAPAVIAGTALAFALSLGEFVASVLLYLPSNVPISVRINMEWRGSGVGSAFAYSVFLVTLVTITFVAARRLGSRVI